MPSKIPASQAQLAAILGVAAPQVHAYVHREESPCPTTSYLNAAKWFLKTVSTSQTAERRAKVERDIAKKSKSKIRDLDTKRRKGALPPIKEFKKLCKEEIHYPISAAAAAEMEKEEKTRDFNISNDELEVAIGMSAEALTLPEQLENLKKQAGYCHKMMEVYRKSGSLLYHGWKKEYEKAFKLTFEVERDLMKIQLEAGKVIAVEEMDGQLRKLAETIVRAIDRAPTRIGNGFSGKTKIAVIEKAKKEMNYLKDALHDVAATKA